MGILARFKDIISANMNALIDKCEDPEKMINQYMRQMSKDLAEVKKETAAVMADEEKAKRKLSANKAQITKYTNLAKQALLAGNEEDAKTFIKKKQELEQNEVSLQQIYDVAASNALKMQQMHDKLKGDIAQLAARKDEIQAKLKIAKAQEKVNQLAESSAVANAEANMNAFAQMEEKANKILDEANAMAKLNSQPVDGLAAAEAKYKDAEFDTKVDDELEALKAQLGL